MLEESLRGGFSSWLCIFYLILPQYAKIAILVVAMFFVPCDGLGPTVLCDLYRSVGAFILCFGVLSMGASGALAEPPGPHPIGGRGSGTADPTVVATPH